MKHGSGASPGSTSSGSNSFGLSVASSYVGPGAEGAGAPAEERCRLSRGGSLRAGTGDSDGDEGGEADDCEVDRVD
jgi:hypothetical protein